MKVLAVGAHPDDIELGCGGALLAHRKQDDEITLLVMTDGSAGPQDSRSRLREQEDAAAMLGARLLWGGYRDNTVPNGPDAITAVEQAITTSGAEVVYTHAPADTHQDHRATAAAVLSAARRATRVLLYESPTSSSFAPSFFVDIDGLVEAKQDLVRAHMSQVLKNGLVDLEALEAQARYHGFRARVRHAEAFECQRFLWEFPAVEVIPPAGEKESPYRDQKELSL